MTRGGARPTLRWTLILVLLLGSALVTAASLQGEDTPEASDPVVGELQLSDGDEGPSDRVEQTFGAPNLAPGDTRIDELLISREPFEDLPPALDPHVAVSLHGNGSSLLASVLEVTELAYGQHDLSGEAGDACGRPLTLARLAACTRTDANPLEDLPDPTPEGTPFRLGVQLAQDASTDVEDLGYGFTAHVELYGEAPSGPAEPLSASGLDDRPIQTGDPSDEFAPCPTSDDVDLGGMASALPVRIQGSDRERLPTLRSAGALWSGGPSPSLLLATSLPPPC